MENCEKSLVLTFYFVFLGSAILEIVFLFEIPYYYFSITLQSIKIIRILLGIINLLIKLFFAVIRYAENLIKKEEQGKESLSSSKRYSLLDKVLIKIALIISVVVFSLNMVGIGFTSNYLKKKDSSSLASYLYIDSMLLLIELILISLCWFYFIIFWAFNIQEFIKSQKIIEKKEKKDNINGAPPAPSQNQQPSSERQVKPNENEE